MPCSTTEGVDSTGDPAGRAPLDRRLESGAILKLARERAGGILSPRLGSAPSLAAAAGEAQVEVLTPRITHPTARLRADSSARRLLAQAPPLVSFPLPSILLSLTLPPPRSLCLPNAKPPSFPARPRRLPSPSQRVGFRTCTRTQPRSPRPRTPSLAASAPHLCIACHLHSLDGISL